MPKGVRKKPRARLVFKDHAPMEVYRSEPIGKNAKSFVTEKYSSSPFKPFPMDRLKPRESDSRGMRTKKKRLKQFHEKGGRLEIGETYYTNTEKQKIKKLLTERGNLEKRMFKYPGLLTIKEYFRKEAECENFRHELVRRTIKRLLKQGIEPVEVQYGTRHSLLARELRQEGINVSSNVQEQPIWTDSHVIRKLRLGKEPSSLEYKKGFLCMLDYHSKEMFILITGKPHEKCNNRDVMFYTYVDSALINNLSEAQVDRVINEKNPHLLFTLNGLPETPSRKQIAEFTEKHSEFFRRKRKRIERKRR